MGGAASVLTVIGARPQFVKAAVLTRAFERAGLDQFLVHTGQHHDPEMADAFVDELGVRPPDRCLGIHGGSRGQVTARMLSALDAVLDEVAPTVVVVVGDTNSTLSGALASMSRRIPVAHVEAGLRSFNRDMPEETNRVLTDHMSTLLFCPTRRAVTNLEAEGIRSGVHPVGDVMYDLALEVAGRLGDRRAEAVAGTALPAGPFAVATVHRAENTDRPEALAGVIGYLRDFELPVVLPLHPRTRSGCERHGISLAGITVLPPVGYLDMARLIRAASVVLTDSGGLQKEAYFHRTPCITLRSETEWVETIDAGWNRLWTEPGYRLPRRDIDEYGDGTAADRVAEVLAEFLDRVGTPA